MELRLVMNALYLSIIDDAPAEIMLLTVRGVEVGYADDNDKSQMQMSMTDFQLDNQLLERYMDSIDGEIYGKSGRESCRGRGSGWQRAWWRER
tara:strand:- start:175 stop:453 length:279 start_codon:yes stop_codon:yes gene_type:complete